MKLYIAGPMRGIREFNFPAFFGAECKLQDANHETINPARRDTDKGFCYWMYSGTEDLSELDFDLSEALAWDLDQIAREADGIALLPGWEDSKGAQAEVATAKALGKPVKPVHEWCGFDFGVGEFAEVGEGAIKRIWGDEEPVDSIPAGALVEILELPDPDGDYEVRWAKEDGEEVEDFIAAECLSKPSLVKRLRGVLVERAEEEPVVGAAISAPFLPGGEIRVTSETGGQKGKKLAELGTVDPLALLKLAEVSGFGAQKYEAFNYLKGYDWSLSFNALTRHLLAFWNGEDNDPESGLPHITHAAWHALALTSFAVRGLGTDDRYKAEEAMA